MTTRFQSMPGWLQIKLGKVLNESVLAALHNGLKPPVSEGDAEGRNDWHRIDEAVRWLSEPVR